MDDFSLARTLHILAVVMWIGGVGFVTTTAMPAIRASHAPSERLHAFHQFERRFVWQARFWVLLAGISGFWMTARAELWTRFQDVSFWWMHAMVLVWLLFFAMLFIIEPMVLHRRMEASPTPEKDFDRMETMHRVLLALSLIAVLAAAAGSHGLL
ncbi:MAG TPA: hypothetical protein PKY87_09790 [Terricaulis sp.]|nr:hypothetical protein [Terricaulis sp.]